MNRPAFTALALVCAVTLAGPLARPAHAAPAPELVTLRNGLRVVLAPDSAATAVAVSVTYAAGARTIPASQEGARHIVERLLLLGGADGARVRLLTAEGGTVGSATTADGIVFWETMPAEALALALRAEAERMAVTHATPHAFDVARRGAAAEARARQQLGPIAAALTRLAGSVFAGQPYARPLVSSEAAIASLPQASVEAWRATRLVPSQAVLVIAGRFEPQATLELVRRSFEGLPRGAAIAAAPLPAPRLGARRVHAAMATPAPMLLAGWRVPGIADGDSPAIDLIATVLGGGEDSRLNNALTVDWHAANAGQCGVDRRRDASMLWAAAVTTAAADTVDAERVLLDVVGGLARDPLPQADLDRARAQLLTSESFRAQDLHVRAQSLAEVVLAGGSPAQADARLAAIARLTPADVQRVARRILDDKARTLMVLVPQGGAR